MIEQMDWEKAGFLFDRGTLYQLVANRIDAALRSGSLQPIKTNCEFYKHNDFEFMVHVLDSLNRKAEEKRIQKKQKLEMGRKQNPFLPFDPELYVSDILPTHIVLLNKFNVVHNHILIVTREYEDQNTLLTVNDLLSLWSVLQEYDGLGFYNGGVIAGASQSHKHLQYVALPLINGRSGLPFDPFRNLEQDPKQSNSYICPHFAFLHSICPHSTFDEINPLKGAVELIDRYHRLLEACGMRIDKIKNEKQQFPYNLLITREWMMVIPRRLEFYQTISLNAMAFIGSFFVMNEQEHNLLKTSSPLSILEHVTFKNENPSCIQKQQA